MKNLCISTHVMMFPKLQPIAVFSHHLGCFMLQLSVMKRFAGPKLPVKLQGSLQGTHSLFANGCRCDFSGRKPKPRPYTSEIWSYCKVGFVVWGRCVEMCFLCVFFHVFGVGWMGWMWAISTRKTRLNQYCNNSHCFMSVLFFFPRVFWQNISSSLNVFFNILEYCLSCVLNSSARKAVFTHNKNDVQDI